MKQLQDRQVAKKWRIQQTSLMETLEALLFSNLTVFLLSSPAKYESLRMASADIVSRLVERRRISGLALFSISSGAVEQT